MAKVWVSIAVASVLIALTGCGGSSTVGSASDPVGGASLSQYQATLPDGSLMEIEILADDDRAWSGDFAVAATSGPYADQTGSFEGTITGHMVNATAALDSGGAFQITGTADGNAGFQLTRSDIPGTVLHFTPVAPSPKKANANVSFVLNVNGSSGRCVISDQPYSNNNGLLEYRGTWLGCKVTFWSYSSGNATVVLYINDFAIDSLTFTTYRLSDFGTVTKTASSSKISIFNPTSNTIISFGGNSTVSPG